MSYAYHDLKPAPKHPRGPFNQLVGAFNRPPACQLCGKRKDATYAVAKFKICQGCIDKLDEALR